MDKELERRLTTIENLSRLSAKRILNISEAAVILGRSEKTVRNRLRDIPHYYGPLGPMFKREELEAWMCEVKCLPTMINNS